MSKTKRIKGLLLLFFLVSVFAGFGVAQAGAVVSPSDIADNWAYDKIVYLVDQGVINGYVDGTFKPNHSISRAEFMVMINRGFGFTKTADISYSDVLRADWFYSEIAKAQAAGYISGFVDGSMKPNNYISRSEAAAIIARVIDLDTSSSGSLPFSDASTIPSWSANSIAAMVQAGYLSGYPDGSFQPLNYISRSEAAVIIYGAMNNRVTGVAIKSAATLTKGDTLTLVATVAPQDAVNKNVTWTSSNKDVATVSSKGKVTAKNIGTAIVTVKTEVGGYTDTCTITVEDQNTALDIPAALDLYLEGNNSKTIIAYVDVDSDIDAVDIEIDGDDVVYFDYNAADTYVEIFLEAFDEGECTITLTVITDDNDEYEAECEVTVYAEADKAALVMPDSLNLYLENNDDKTIMAYLDVADSDIEDISLDTAGDDVVDLDYIYGAAYVALNIDGNKEGECTVTLMATTADGDEYQARCEVTVYEEFDAEEALASDFDLSDSDITMDRNEEVSIKAYIPNGYSISDVEDLAWGSDDDSVADIRNYNYAEDNYIEFIVKADEKGDCTIAIYLTIDGDEYRAEANITVEGSSGDELRVSGGEDVTLGTNDKDSIRIYLPDSYTMDDVGDITWESDDESVADITADAYGEDNDKYFTLDLESYESGECTITIYVEVAGDEYDVDLEVTVEDD